VAFVVRTTDLEANRGRTDLWMVGSDGSGLARLTTHEANDSDPRWAPDGGSLYFLSTRSGSSQVWRLSLAGGDPEPVTKLPVDVQALSVSPAGTHLAFSASVFPDCDTLAATADRLAARAKSKASGQLHERIFIRHWDTWMEGRRNHLFVLPLGGGEPVDLSRDLDADVPSLPFGGGEEIAWSRDGREIVFAARLAGRTEPWSTNLDLWAAPIDRSSPPRNLTADNPATDTGPVFSPDGRTLAYRAMSRPGYEADRLRVMLLPWPAGRARVLAEGWDRSPETLAFSPDGGTLFATAADLGEEPLFAIDVASGEARRLFAGGTVRSPAVAGSRLIFGHDHLRRPVELTSLALDGTDPRQLTSINASRLAAIRWGEPEPFSFAGWNGETVHAWFVKPVDYDPARRYPLAFVIHGGPQGSSSNNFHYRWNLQTYAGAGYAAVAVDFHGSTGYGQAFTDSIGGDWGGKPLEDLQKGLAATLARYPWIDPERVCALGASYGGYMINWIAGNWPEAGGRAPFRCLVNHDGIFDQRSMYYTTEELWFPEWEHGGPYFERPQGHERHNPALAVERWKTPMLVVHGGLDYRVPDSQGIATFTALQRRGVASKLLYFPDENHWVLKPANSILWHDTVLAWLDQWTP
jgi:dipeptidyl aminopeptidase/acylaminoacyl peptidase